MDGYHTITIEAFVPYEEINRIYSSGRTTSVRRRARNTSTRSCAGPWRSGLAASRDVIRNHEHLGCLRIGKKSSPSRRCTSPTRSGRLDEIEPRNISVGKEGLGWRRT